MLPIIIRPEMPGDSPLIQGIHRTAFGRVAEGDLVDRLRANGDLAISLVAEFSGELIGHIAFSPMRDANGRLVSTIFGLAPVSVMPLWQRSRSIGGLLIIEGCAAARRRGALMVILLGHPSYYPRFGFVPAGALGFRWKGRDPGRAFMVKSLFGAAGALSGEDLDYAPAFGGLT